MAPGAECRSLQRRRFDRYSGTGRETGARWAAIHPLQTFASVNQAIENIPGSTFAVEAEEPLLSTLKEMAAALGGHWIELKASDKVAYHAAAVMACNYLVTLVKLATDLWQTFCIPPSPGHSGAAPADTRHTPQY